jgi:hypothetical protein
MAIETAFAKKVTGSQDSDDRFLALLGNDGKLDLALLDVKDRVAGVPLWEDDLILPIFRYCLSFAHLGEKYLRIKRGFGSLPQSDSPFRARQVSPSG